MIKVLFCTLCFGFSCLGFAQSVRMTVLDSVSSKPISGATIYLIASDQNVTTNSEGQASVIPLSTAAAAVKIVAQGYRAFHGDVNLQNKEVIIYLKAYHLDLHEVTVSSGATQLKNKNAFHIESRKLSDLNAISSVNLGEIISKIPGVYAASLGNGISKPVIRGMQGMRIVTLLNGLRLEGQQWGGDHGIGLTSLGISGVEVIKGPVSLLYGADAFGGVIYLIDVPFAQTNTVSVDANVDAFSNTLGGRSQAMIRQSKERFRWLGALNYSNHADFQLPDGKFAKNSRFNDLAAKLSLSYSGTNSLFALRYTMSHSTTGIPGHTHDSTATPLTFQVDKRGRSYELPAQFFQNHLLQASATWYQTKWEMALMFGGTANRLIEYDEKVTKPSLSMTLLNGISQARWTYKFNPKVKWISGFQGMAQRNTNATNASDTLIPNASVFDAGLFTMLQAERGSWAIQSGMRYDLRGLLVDKISGPLWLNYQGFNGSLGAVWSHKQWVLRANVSTGFRAPHLTELFSNGYHHGALRYEVGNAQLKPEKAAQLDITLEWNSDHSAVVLNPFGNYIRDYIFLQPMNSSMNGIPVFSYAQNNQVLFLGADLGYHFHPHFAHGLHWEISGSYISVNTLGDSSVSLIPQPRLMNTLEYKFNVGKKIKIKDFSVQSTFMGPQNLVAYNETPSKAYHVLDANLGLSLGAKPWLEIKFGVRNILNTLYIDHLSRLKNIQMPFPGRNIYISLSYSIIRNLKSQIP